MTVVQRTVLSSLADFDVFGLHFSSSWVTEIPKTSLLGIKAWWQSFLNPVCNYSNTFSSQAVKPLLVRHPSHRSWFSAGSKFWSPERKSCMWQWTPILMSSKSQKHLFPIPSNGRGSVYLKCDVISPNRTSGVFFFSTVTWVMRECKSKIELALMLL